VPKKAFLTANVSSILTNPDCPPNSCIVGNTVVDKALLDLCSSITLLPLSIYQQLELKDKPTRVTIQLADRSIKVPHGVIKDVLIKVGKFMFSVNFIVQEIQPVTKLKGQITFILGRPFPSHF